MLSQNRIILEISRSDNPHQSLRCTKRQSDCSGRLQRAPGSSVQPLSPVFFFRNITSKLEEETGPLRSSILLLPPSPSTWCLILISTNSLFHVALSALAWFGVWGRPTLLFLAASRVLPLLKLPPPAFHPPPPSPDPACHTPSCFPLFFYLSIFLCVSLYSSIFTADFALK